MDAHSAVSAGYNSSDRPPSLVATCEGAQPPVTLLGGQASLHLQQSCTADTAHSIPDTFADTYYRERRQSWK